MKVYIPFNSNDFNSVFTTLSISPTSYYPNRKYSFKRASTTFLNENENFLIGYEKRIFNNNKTDKDYGFPVLLEVNVDENMCSHTDETGIKYFVINSTIYLFDEFKLFFRKEHELNETLAKSLKSIETKFANLAKANSYVIKEDYSGDKLPSPKTPLENKKNNSNTFIEERKLNRILGVILGSSIAFSNNASKEWREISNLLRTLNNDISLYLNKIGESNGLEKKKSSLGIIKEVSRIYESIETLDEAIVRSKSTTLTDDILNLLKKENFLGKSAYDRMIGGLLADETIDDLPIPLKFKKLTLAINSKFNSKYPSNYTTKINKTFNKIKHSIEEQITLSRRSNKLNLDDLITPKFIKGNLDVKIPESLNKSEEDNYLKQTLLYFIQTDAIVNVEYFLANREQILIEIGEYFDSGNIQGFKGSEESKYIRSLFDSFKSLRRGFEISSTQNQVLKSIAILFTTGRDFSLYVENNEKEGIQPIIYYSLWGAIYGAAILPKTATELVTDDKNNLQIIITAFNSALNNFKESKLPIKTDENDENHFQSQQNL